MAAATVLTILEKTRPRLIVELGSGESTVWFAAYAAKHGAKVISFGENEDWRQKGLAAIKNIAPVDMRLLAVERTNETVRYALPIPQEADLVFVDVPAV